MKTIGPYQSLQVGLLAAVLLAIGATANAADRPALKDAYKDHFMVGTAINRNIATGTGGGRRTLEQVEKDIALTKEQFNQITAESDMKWQFIHPYEGADGYDFTPADAFVEFGAKNRLYLVGHTLIWHSQTPNWVFVGTNQPPGEVGVSSGTSTEPNTSSPPGRGRGRGFGGFGRNNGPRASRDELLQRRDSIVLTQ